MRGRGKKIRKLEQKQRDWVAAGQPAYPITLSVPTPALKSLVGFMPINETTLQHARANGHAVYGYDKNGNWRRLG